MTFSRLRSLARLLSCISDVHAQKSIQSQCRTAVSSPSIQVRPFDDEDGRCDVAF